MNKYIIIMIFGAIETFFCTWWTLSANKKQLWVSSFVMFIYMGTYLTIVDTMFKDNSSKFMILFYAVGCAIGNFIKIYREKKNG